MKINLMFRIKFYFTLFNTKLTMYILSCKTLFKKKYWTKINNILATLDKTKQFL